MAKLQTQWEFSDLLTQTPARRVLSVSELTLTIKRLLEQQIGRIWVSGEVTNLRLQSSGHLYFAVKDPNAHLNCVLFRGEARGFNRDLLRDGVGVNLHGDLTVYEARGQYQLIVSSVELQGVGALQAAFERLKQRLQAEGLFAAARKRPLPRYPERIGLVTSKSGAALHDVLQAISRRHPGLQLILASCRVQGQGAGEELACAIRWLNEWADPKRADRRLDLILITRGGGSLEDLWAFNEEVVARAIFESAIPVISGVGHEIDFTICDFVADFRAATPTAAAEIITEGFFASRSFLREVSAQLIQLLLARLSEKREDLGFLAQRLQRQHPLRWLQEQFQRLDDLQNSLIRSARYGFRLQVGAAQTLSQRFRRVRPSQVLARHQERVQGLRRRLDEVRSRQLVAAAQRLSAAASKLRLLSPLSVLDRGYSITTDATNGHVIQSASEVRAGQTLRTRLREGEIESVAQTLPDVSKKPAPGARE